MCFATVMSDLLLWSLVGGYAAHQVLIRMFGAEWPKQLGDYLRQWWLSKGGETDQTMP
jgi:hypothetical protein